MVGRFRERQYQLAAQKQNEAYWRYNYYQQTARYFEREDGITRQFDSWNLRKPDLAEQIEKAKKAERLLIRRDKLRKLLRDEDEQYRRELERRTKKKPEQAPTLDVLKQKLKEKRAEQSLYLPQACRRYQSYFVSAKDSVQPRWSTFSNTELRRSTPCKDSTNTRHSYPFRYSTMEPSKVTNESEVCQDQRGAQNSHQPDDIDARSRPSSKYSARARRSLENTNVTSAELPEAGDGASDFQDEKLPAENSVDEVNGDKSPHEQVSEESQDDVRAEKSQKDMENERKSSICLAMQNETDELEKMKELLTHQVARSPTADEVDEVEAKQKKEVKDLQIKDHCQYEGERSLPWLRMDPHEKNLSEQMFLYLTHNELRQKMDDLVKRELHACNKNCWDEALRLRDMRNRLELLREKRLFNMESLHLDNDIKKIALANIEKREEELSGREYACADSTMYSDEAKDLWKKWVEEDDASVMKDARVQREALMKKLEEDWRNLAIHDKDRITQSFQKVLHHSALQEEHELTAAMTATKKDYAFDIAA